MSIRDIASMLGVSKGSVSLWVRDVQLTSEQIADLDRRMRANRARFGYLSRCGGANTNRADAEKRHRAFLEDGYQHAKGDERFRLICALYWGEGSKRQKNAFRISNCDPALLRVILNWLIEAGFEDRIAFRVQYYAENGWSEDEIRRWWSSRLKRLEERHWRRFVVCKLNRASQRKKIGRLPQGTASIEVCSTELLHRVLGGIEYLKDMGDW